MNNYFKVLRPGINSTFQDLGRFGLQHLGIVASGCMDQLSFCNSNKLVDNKISEGALEFAYQGPLLEMNGENALVAISGQVNFNLIKKNGETIKGKSNESFLVSNGDKIDILSTINSVYGYLSIFEVISFIIFLSFSSFTPLITILWIIGFSMTLIVKVP